MITGVKICGIRAAEALEAALEAGADYIGLVLFPPSPRHVAPAEAARLAARARGRAGVVVLTVDASDAEMRDMLDAVRPDILQFHGTERPETIGRWRTRVREIWKCVPVGAAADLAAAARYLPVADRILFDARAPKDATRPGGNARRFDWRLLTGLDLAKPFVLSGGLDPGNVAAAIRETRPATVDVSSGVERAPGEKDPDLIRAFVRAAHAADMSLQKARAET